MPAFKFQQNNSSTCIAGTPSHAAITIREKTEICTR